MRVFQNLLTDGLMLLLGLPIATLADKGFYKQDFSMPIPNFEAYAMQRFDGNAKDSVWNVDSYKHTGPFAFSQENGALKITTQGYWEWDYCVLVLPAPVRVQTDDTLTMEVRIGAGSTQDSAQIGLQLGYSEKQSENSIIYPNPPSTLVKKDWVKVSVGRNYGDDIVTHIFINIDVGYTTGPTSGWFLEPNKPFNGTVEIKNVSLDGSLPVVLNTQVKTNRPPRVVIDGNSIQIPGESKHSKIEIYDLFGHRILVANQSLTFKNKFQSGLYYYRSP